MVILGFIFIIFIYFFFIRDKKNKKILSSNYNNSLFIKKKESIANDKLLDKEVMVPLDGFNYTISFWIYLDDYTYNFDYWRHILHKGTYIEQTIAYDNWNNLNNIINQQSPGIWLSPQKNILRICFTTQINKMYCEIFNNSIDCVNNEVSYCEWTGNKCISKDKHVLSMGENKKYNSVDINQIEYVDIEIPSKTLINISFSLDNGIINVFINGKLHKNHKLIGEPVFNKGDLYFFYGKTIKGSIYNLNYIPESVNLSSFVNNVPKINN